jgi:endonuclease I
MNTYIGNPAYSETENDLHDAFSAFGQVEKRRTINDNFSGRSITGYEAEPSEKRQVRRYLS